MTMENITENEHHSRATLLLQDHTVTVFQTFLCNTLNEH